MKKHNFKKVLLIYILFIFVWNFYIVPIIFNDILYKELTKMASCLYDCSIYLVLFIALKLGAYLGVNTLFYPPFARRLASIGLPKPLFFISYIETLIFPLILVIICILKKGTHKT